MNSNILLHGDFHSVADLPQNLIGWEVDFSQTSPGALDSECLVFKSGCLLLTQATFNRHMLHCGAAPAGHLTFSLQLGAHEAYPAYGKPFSQCEILLLPATRELDSISPPNFNNCNISLPVDMVETLAGQADCSDMVRDLSPGGTFRPSPESLGRLKRLLRRTCAHLPREGGQPHFDPVREDILNAFSQCLLSVRGTPARLAPNKRRRTVHRAMEYIREGCRDPIPMAELSDAVGVSERTLHYAFKQHLGITPLAYAKSYRLHGVRRELEQKRTDRITEAASRWGFWHMGQFGADYKRLFGERPSDTLRRPPERPTLSVVPSELFRA